jgi:transposase
VLMGLPSGSRIWLAAGFTDLRKGMDGLSALVQTALHESPYSGQMFVFRGRRGDKLKILWHSGDGICLFCKRLSDGKFVWPQAQSGTVSMSAAQRCCSKGSTGDDRSALRRHRRTRIASIRRVPCRGARDGSDGGNVATATK